MIIDNFKIQELQYDSIIEYLMESKSISLDEAKTIITGLSFKEYHSLIEANAQIIPPSGRIISPQQVGSTAPAAGQGVPVPKAPGAPIQPGDGNSPVLPGQQVQGDVEQLVPPGQQIPVPPGQPQPTAETQMIQRLRELAGIKETCSAGATGAGAVAIAPASMGSMRKREVDEAPKKEYVRTAPPKTIIGDTKPQQASGELSSTNAVRGLPTATRKNNGFR